MKTYLYRASNLKSTITFLTFVHSESQFLAPAKNRRFLRFIHTTEAIATSLIPLVTNFHEICAFTNGFSFIVWTKMRLLLAH